jgi:Zn-dependent peptidase ImmA (M78 family)
MDGVSDAFSMADRLVSEYAFRTGEVALRPIAQSLGVSSIEPLPMDVDGFVIRKRDGSYIIRYKPDSSRERQRFTVAHEVAHIIMERCSGQSVPERQERTRAEYSAVESLADKLAARLLLPERIFVDRLREYCAKSLSRYGSIRRLDIVKLLVRSFGASKQCVVFRLLEVTPLQTILLRVEAEDFDSTESPPLYSWDCSGGLRLMGDPMWTASHVLWQHSSTRSRRHFVGVRVPQGERTLRCEGWRSSGTGRCKYTCYWALGWTWQSPDSADYDDAVDSGRVHESV